MRRHGSTVPQSAVGMSTQRILLVNVVIILIISGHLYDIVVGTEHWPFSQYRLFASIQEEQALTQPQLFGVPRENPDQEFPLGQFSRTFDGRRLVQSFRRISNSKRFTSEERQQMLNDKMLESMSQYERQRLAGRHDGPPLRGVRLYEATWEFASFPQSTNDPPDRKELIAEVEQP